MSPSTTKNKKKPQGEFVWVIDGKTEYFGQLVEPLCTVERKGEDNDSCVKVEVQWTHNGLFDWVSYDQLRIELSPTGQSVSSRGKSEWTNTTPENIESVVPATVTPGYTEVTPTKKLPETEANDDIEKDTPKSNEENRLQGTKADIAFAVETLESRNPPESKKRDTPSSPEAVDLSPKQKTSNHEEPHDVKEEKVESSVESEVERTVEEPPLKRRRVASDQKSSGGNGLFASFTQQVTDAKNAFVSGFQEIYNELIGPS